MVFARARHDLGLSHHRGDMPMLQIPAETALRRLRRALKENQLRLTVNLTQNSLVSPKFFHWLENRISHFGRVAEQLVFQISEIDVLIAQHHMDYFCHKLNPLNIRLCVSHFGCTADPFRYLPLLRAHAVKLDVSLLEKLRLNLMKIQQLKRTINRLHETGLRVIAAMIDDMSLLPLLWRSKVNFAQGYCLHKPNSAMNFEFLKDETLSL